MGIDTLSLAVRRAGTVAEGNVAACSGGESLAFLADVTVVINDIDRGRIIKDLHGYYNTK